MEAGPILTSKQREEVVHGVPTEVVCTAFSNSVLVVVTQYGKMGTIVYVDPNTIGDSVGRPSLTTKVLLGKDEVRAGVQRTGSKGGGKRGRWDCASFQGAGESQELHRVCTVVRLI